jgi:hypothetical protein
MEIQKGEKMYCPNCRCEFDGWVGKCPNCKTPLVSESPHAQEITSEPIPYEQLVDLVKENGGQYSVELITTDVGKKKWGFPYFGYRFAWVKRMQGNQNRISVDLLTTEVGTETRWSFPYLGYGYAWRKGMEGNVAGNTISLAATKVRKEKKWGFPYSGYGYAWTQELSGECGAELRATLITTDVSRKKGWRFPYFGYGSAWAKKGVLTLTTIE